MIKKTSLLLALILTFSVSACQQQLTEKTETPTDKTETTSSVKTSDLSYNPCDLMTAEDLASLFPGKTVEITRNDTVPNPVGQKICYYDLSSDDMIFAQLSFTNQADMNPRMIESGQTAETLFAEIKDFTENPTTVNGLGSEAYYGGAGLTVDAGLSVLVKEKQVFFTVTVGLGFGNSDKDAHIQIEKTLAENILSRI